MVEAFVVVTGIHQGLEQVLLPRKDQTNNTPQTQACDGAAVGQLGILHPRDEKSHSDDGGAACP